MKSLRILIPLFVLVAWHNPARAESDVQEAAGKLRVVNIQTSHAQQQDYKAHLPQLQNSDFGITKKRTVAWNAVIPPPKLAGTSVSVELLLVWFVMALFAGWAVEFFRSSVADWRQ